MTVAIIDYVREQQLSAGLVPDEKTLLVETWRDELGRLAVQFLLERFKEARTDSVHHVIAPTLVTRRTSSRQNRAARGICSALQRHWRRLLLPSGSRFRCLRTRAFRLD